ncbi:MAG: thioredoxin domain-containing protein, partial [Thermoanaerobaculia bacterium]
RARPGRDEKVLAGWNGWMLAAFAEAALAFDSDELREVVVRNADFLLAKLVSGDRVTRSWKEGVAKIDGLLEDYGGVAWGMIAAFEATQNRTYLESARTLAAAILERFRDADQGAFWDTPADGERLITRPRDAFDNATPSGNSLAVAALFRLAAYYGDAKLERAARTALEALWPLARRYPSAFGFLLAHAAEWAAGNVREIAITGPRDDLGFRTLLQVVGESFLPSRILVWSDARDLPLMEDKPQDRIAAWVCEGYHCLAPTTDPEELRSMLE